MRRSRGSRPPGDSPAPRPHGGDVRIDDGADKESGT